VPKKALPHLPPWLHDQKSSKIEIWKAYESYKKVTLTSISYPMGIPFSSVFDLWVRQHHRRFEVQEGELVKGLQSFKSLIDRETWHPKKPMPGKSLEYWHPLEMSISSHSSYQFISSHINSYKIISIEISREQLYQYMLQINYFCFFWCWNSCFTCQTEQGTLYLHRVGYPQGICFIPCNASWEWIRATIVNAKPKKKTSAMKSVSQLSFPEPLTRMTQPSPNSGR